MTLNFLLLLLSPLMILFIGGYLIQRSRVLPQKITEAFEQQLHGIEEALTQKIASEIANEGNKLNQQQNQHAQQLFETSLKSQHTNHETLQKWTQSIFEQQTASTRQLQHAISENFGQQHKQLHEVLTLSVKQLQDQFQKLTQSTERHLVQISQSMESHLMKGFEKTNETFTNIIQRLALIDDAQKKITDLSQNVVSLQQILNDKRSRGAFGEVQLSVLVKNVLPENCYQLQYTLSNHLRADCILFLPEPTGKIVIDAKFPLESFQKLSDFESSAQQKTEALRQFKIDIKKHIQDISEKYIIPEETAEGAIMFIPAEAVFAEIHAHHPDLVALSHDKKVWMASPTTLMAVLTTAQSVIKDFETREQVHLIQKHLKLLAQDFMRFEKRMDNLSKHLQQANSDAELVNTSAKKISRQFYLIENVKLDDSTLSEEGFTEEALVFLPASESNISDEGEETTSDQG